jgi:hypothetical protein
MMHGGKRPGCNGKYYEVGSSIPAGEFSGFFSVDSDKF